MFNRVFKRSVVSRSRFNQRENYKLLFLYISFSGFEIILCFAYFRNKEKYVMAEGFFRYKAYVLYKRQYNNSGIPINSFNNITKKRN